MKSIFLFAAIFFSLPLLANCTTYYVDSNLANDCNGNVGTSYNINDRNCTANGGIIAFNNIVKANTILKAGDIAYIRGGTYIVTTYGINPVNNGTDINNRITYSGYTSENVVIAGANNKSGSISQGIYLNNKSYIYIKNISFTNMFRGFTISAGGYNEITQCIFTFRNTWADILETGTAKNDNDHYLNSSNILYDNTKVWSNNSWQYKRLYNKTDHSTAYAINNNDANTITTLDTHRLKGGIDNRWHYGDEYEITYNAIYGGCLISGGSVNNYIHHNSMHGIGGFLDDYDGGVVFQIGADQGVLEHNDYNTIEYNEIYDGGHHVLGVNNARYSVIRNNYVHGEAWFDDSDYGGKCTARQLCGYRVVSSTVTDENYGGHSLWENNTIGYGDAYGGPHLIAGGSSGGMTLATPSNIYRYNLNIGNAEYGLRIGASFDTANNNNKIYNNTIYHNGFRSVEDPNTMDIYRTGILFNTATSKVISGTAIKNNLLYDSWSQGNRQYGSWYYPAITAGLLADVAKDNIAYNSISNNYVNTNNDTYYSSANAISEMSNPLFVNPYLPSNRKEIIDAWKNYIVNLPDLRLTAQSPAIDKGKFLTRAIGNGMNSNILFVEDAGYFQDGTWGSVLSRDGIYADWIAVGEKTNIVQIEAIVYSENKIILKQSMIWNNNNPIWLYKKSDGEKIFQGISPDMGAYERTIDDVKIPNNLRILK
jgi:hypothetical protein